MNDPVKKPSEQYAFLKKPIAVDQDGVTCVVIHEKARTELGRLLSHKANVPFNVYGKPNKYSDSGSWETIFDAVTALGNKEMIHFIYSYYTNSDNDDLTAKDKESLKDWYNWKIQQNWYLLDLLVREKLPIVFVYQDTIEQDGVVFYRPILAYDFLMHSIRNLKTATWLKWQRQKGRDDKREKKRVLKGKTPVATQQPKRNKNEDSKPQRKRD